MKHKAISEELLLMKTIDVECREKLWEQGELEKGYHPEMEKIHIRNAERLDLIIEDIGYPTIAKVGKKASDAAWLIIQHAISLPPFMKKCLLLMEKELTLQSIDPIHHAFLKDRIATFQDLPQSYGTQFYMNEKNEFVPHEMDQSVENVDAKRKALGLSTIREKQMEITAAYQDNPAVVRSEKLMELQKQIFTRWKVKTGWIKLS